jgi:hypothetical protein
MGLARYSLNLAEHEVVGSRSTRRRDRSGRLCYVGLHGSARPIAAGLRALGLPGERIQLVSTVRAGPP